MLDLFRAAFMLDLFRAVCASLVWYCMFVIVWPRQGNAHVKAFHIHSRLAKGMLKSLEPARKRKAPGTWFSCVPVVLGAHMC